MTNRNDIEQLFRLHFAQMHRLAAVILHDDECAADIVQDVFASLLEREDDILVSGGYLMNAVRNRCMNYIRDCDIHQRIANAYPPDDESEEINLAFDEERGPRLDELVSSELTSQARRVIQLHFFSGLTFAKVAAEMGISETAVYGHLRHALVKIRKKLNQNG